MEYKLEDIIDVELLQNLQDKLNLVYSFPSAIIDNDGKILTAVAWQDICTKFHRRNPECEKECIKSDQYILEHLKEANPAVSYQCPHGLIDNATPIIIKGKHYGNFFTGQFFLEKPDIEFFRKQAKRYDFDEKEYIEAVKKVPIWTKDKLKLYLDFIKGFIEIIAEIGLNNLKEVETNKILKENLVRNQSILQTAMDGFWLVDLNGRIVEVNDAYCRMSGYSEQELLNMSISDLEAIEGDEEISSRIQKLVKKDTDRFISKHRRKDGKIFDVEISIQYQANLGEKFVCFLRDITDEKLAQEDLIKAKEKVEENEEKYRLLFERDTDAIFIYDPETTYIIEANKATSILYGYSSKELLGKSVLEFSAEKEQSTAQIKKIKKEGKTQVSYRKHKKKDGSIIYVDVKGFKINLQGKDVMFAVSKDITDKILAEEALHSNYDLLKIAGETARFGGFIVDLENMTPIWSDAVLDIHELPHGYIPSIEKGIEFYAPKWRSKITQVFNDCAQKGIPYDEELEIITAKGNKVWVRTIGKAVKDEKGKIIRVQGSFQDITEYKEAKETLYMNEEMLLNSQSVANICSYSTNLVVTDINKSQWVCSPEFYNIFGIDKNYPHTIAGWVGFIHPDYRDEIVAYHESVVIERKTFNREYKIIRINDGIERWVHGTGELVYDEKGNPIRMHGAIQDITVRKKAELKIAENQILLEKHNKALKIAKEKAEESDRLKTEFINNMSHEIRTPMNGILGFTKLLNKKDISDEKRKHYANIVQNSGNQLMRVIDDILEISKLGTKQVKISEKEICLNDLLLEQFSIFDIKAKENNTPLYLKKGLTDAECTILTDESKLNKICSNLLENALKFTYEGFIEFGYVKKDKVLEIFIKDTGIGVSKDKQEAIFERFSQEEKELSKNVGGLGLGLSIAKENAELLGGNIRLISKKGYGSKFIVTIPFKQANKDTNENKKKALETKETYTVLIVEDEEVNHLFLETLLEDEIEINFNILHVKNGKEAVEMCKDNSEIDIVLMDLKMPVMNGFEATKLIKEYKPNLAIVAQTAYSAKEDKEKALLAGCDDFISKPINDKTLNEIMNKYLIKR